MPGDILSKTKEELNKLAEMGLNLLYIGAESGSDKLLKLINKSETFSSTCEGILKAKEAGIDSSVMIINGLGGKDFSEEHYIDSAKLINAVQPKFLSTLVLGLYQGIDEYTQSIGRKFMELNDNELLEELYKFINLLELSGTIFRSDHASNLLPLKGVLPKDKEKLLNSLRYCIGI